MTAYAAINALGTTTRDVVAHLRDGLTGLGSCPLELPFETPTGALPEPPPALPASLAAWDSRTARLAVAGLEEILPALARAIARHGADRVAMVVGTTTSGLGAPRTPTTSSSAPARSRKTTSCTSSTRSAP